MIALITFRESANCEVPHYAFFSSFLFFASS
jgi:hypothetical protein